MNFKNMFRQAGNQLEGEDAARAQGAEAASKPLVCPSCGKKSDKKELIAALSVCPYCGYNFRISARRRIAMLTDPDTFSELYGDMRSQNILGFPDYDEKLEASREKSRENEGVICGVAEIGGYPCCLFVMESRFMMGSMGTVVGEKITRLFEYATGQGLPVIGVTVSGGARMQEGMYSLSQMAKVSGAVKYHSDAGNLYVVLLTDPTTGGVSASFAMLGDVILAEPGALIGFAGPRVIEQTIRKSLPKGFQSAEFLLSCGYIDEIVPRRRQKDYLTLLLRAHRKGEGYDRI